jgi:hypothetical protein
MDIKTLMSEDNGYWNMKVIKRNKWRYASEVLRESWLVTVQQSGKINTVITLYHH